MLSPRELGALISGLRHEKKLTQRALAEQLHVTDKAVSRWERGLGYPDFQLLDPLCQALGVSVERLLQALDRAQRRLAGGASCCRRSGRGS